MLFCVSLVHPLIQQGVLLDHQGLLCQHPLSLTNEGLESSLDNLGDHFDPIFKEIEALLILSS